jgi:lambda family phage portal protein
MKPAVVATKVGLNPEQAKAWQDDVSQRFLMWATSTNADASGRLDFYDLQYLAFTSVLASGDTFALLPAVQIPGWPYQFAVQLIEADRVCNRDRVQDAPNLVQGVVMDASGRPVGYDVLVQHPASAILGSEEEWRRIPAAGQSGRRSMIHLYEQKRPDQVRGVPYLSVVVEKLKDLSRYSEAELSAAVTSAALTVFTRMAQDGFEQLSEDNQNRVVDRALGWDGMVGPGTMGKSMAINLLPGEEIEVPDSKRPNANFDPFFLAMVRQVGVGLELPFEVLIKHFTSSYSASRAALLDAWRTFRRRRDWLAKRFCQPIYEEWLADEVIAGRISAPGFFADPMVRWAYSQATWIGDGPGSIDPEKEVNAAVTRMREGLSTLDQESILHDGVGWETKHAQRVSEVTARRKDGLEIDPTVIAAPVPPGRPPKADAEQ